MVPPWLRQNFAALAVPQFRILWLGSLIAFVTLQMSHTARNVVAFDIAGTNAAVGVVGLGSGIAFLLVTPYGGVIADRVSKRRVVVLGHGWVGLVTLGLAILILTDQITIPLLLFGTFASGVAASFFAPARQAYVAEVAPRRLLPNAIALSQLAQTSGRVVGPFLAAALIGIGAIGAGGAYVVMTGLFVLVLATLLRLPGTTPGRAGAPRAVLADLMAGLRHVQERPRLRLLVVAFTALVLFAYPFEFVLPGLLENRLGREAADLGLLMGFSAIAGLAVSVSLAGFVGGRRAWPLMIALGGTLALGLLVVAAAPSFGIALAGMLLVGTGQAGFRLFNTALLMLEAAPPYYGRVYAITILGFGIENIAAAPVGILADAIGERSMLGILGGGTLACTLLTAMAYAALQRRGRRAPLPALEVADGSLGDEADGDAR